MYIWRKLPPGLITGFLISTGQATAHGKERPDVATSPTPGVATHDFVVLFGPLSPKIAGDLPAYRMTDEVGAMRPTAEDLRVQKMALALIARAIEYIDREGPFVDSGFATEHREG
jgi:hypothetical protein